MRKLTINGHAMLCSIAMLNYQRVSLDHEAMARLLIDISSISLGVAEKAPLQTDLTHDSLSTLNLDLSYLIYLYVYIYIHNLYRPMHTI